jgi:hypothetical protein
MRLLSTGLCTILAVALLAGCSGTMSRMGPLGSTNASGSSSSASHVRNMGHPEKPIWQSPANFIDNGPAIAPPIFRETLAKLTPVRGSQPSKGMYVNQFYEGAVLAYQNKNTGNNAPFCSVPTGSGSDVNGIAVDGKGNLITPEAANVSGQHAVVIWQGPGMCGAEVGSFTDPYGQPSNAASFDAVNGTVVVGNIFDNSGAPGSLSICTLSGGCTANLTNPAMYKVAGVALAKNGDCWASAENSATSPAATLTYFAGCTGAGVVATGFMNVDYGGLSIDKNGNLVSVDKTGEQLWVYSGCNPACTLVGGPFPLVGLSVFGAVNGQSMAFMAGDQTNNQVDVYYYSPTALTFWYSYNNGISPSGKVEGVAYNPASKQ